MSDQTSPETIPDLPQYFLLVDGIYIGPCSWDGVKKAILEGQVERDSLCRLAGDATWLPMGMVFPGRFRTPVRKPAKRALAASILSVVGMLAVVGGVVGAMVAGSLAPLIVGLGAGFMWLVMAEVVQAVFDCRRHLEDLAAR